MIENIKRLVNEHHTLIVVIIAVLVICFIYWLFCCKDRPLANKTNGGRCAIYFDKNKPEIQFIGKPLAKSIPMLSMTCVDMLAGKIDSSKTFININYLTSSFISHLKIPTILEDPLNYLIKNGGYNIQSKTHDSPFVGLRLFKNFSLKNKIDIFYDTFDFDSIMKKVFDKDKDFVDDVLELLSQFTKEMNRDTNINLARFIGQVGRPFNMEGLNETVKDRWLLYLGDKNSTISLDMNSFDSALVEEREFIHKYVESVDCIVWRVGELCCYIDKSTKAMNILNYTEGNSEFILNVEEGLKEASILEIKKELYPIYAKRKSEFDEAWKFIEDKNIRKRLDEIAEGAKEVSLFGKIDSRFSIEQYKRIIEENTVRVDQMFDELDGISKQIISLNEINAAYDNICENRRNSKKRVYVKDMKPAGRDENAKKKILVWVIL